MKPKSTLHKLLANVTKQDKSIYIYCIFYTLVTVLVPLFPVLLPKLLISELISPNPQIQNILWITGVFFLFAGLFNFISTYLLHKSYARITRVRIDYVRDTAVKNMTMAYKNVEDATFYETYEKAIESTSSNDTGIEGIYHRLFSLPATAITVLTLSFFIGFKSIFILIALLIHILMSALVQRWVQKFQYKKKESLSKASRRASYYNNTTCDFSYGKDLRLYHLKERLLSNYHTEIKNYVKIFALIKQKEYTLSFLTIITLLISDVATYGILIYDTINGMSIADFSMYLTAILSLSVLMTQLMTAITFVMNEMMYATDFYRFHETDYGEKGGNQKAVPSNETLEIEFKHVTFAYPKTDKNIFTDLNLKISKGQRLAIVGINGAGKTTLVKLMTGLFDPDEGEILINGTNVKDYDKQELYSMFGVVFQDINILAFTIAENIACTSTDIDQEKVNQVLERVGLSDTIKELPKGVQTMMLKIIEEDGTELSGGQKQKLSIARALYKGGNMVIMDEPTAALDALAEADIYQQFSGLVSGKTAVFISHRLASTRFCDKIALFDADGLSEYGTHDELMQLQGKYFEMFTIQGKYYQEERKKGESLA